MDLSEAQQARLKLRSTPVVSDFAQVMMPALPPVPGMISESECRYLYWLISQGYCGAGAVVEVGTWLGRSTTCLAAGLLDAGHAESLHCFDKFTWTRRHTTISGVTLRKGDSFQPLFERNIRPLYPLVRVTRGDIQDLTWSGGPIEILFLDAPKRLDDISAALATFGPSLVPDLSLIVLQDYQHEPSYPLAAVLGQLSDRLELLHVVEDGGTVSFLVRKPLDLAQAQPVDWNFHRWDPAQTEREWARIVALLPEGAGRRLQQGLAFLMFDQGRIKEACQFIRSFKLDTAETERWKGFALTHLYQRYRPLFKSLGIKPTHSAWQALRSLKRRLRRAIKRRFARLSEAARERRQSD